MSEQNEPPRNVELVEIVRLYCQSIRLQGRQKLIVSLLDAIEKGDPSSVPTWWKDWFLEQHAQTMADMAEHRHLLDKVSQRNLPEDDPRLLTIMLALIREATPDS